MDECVNCHCHSKIICVGCGCCGDCCYCREDADPSFDDDEDDE